MKIIAFELKAHTKVLTMNIRIQIIFLSTIFTFASVSSVFFGTDAKREQFPFYVLIKITKNSSNFNMNNNNFPVCGGTLYHSGKGVPTYHVLTAWSCLKRYFLFRFFHLNISHLLSYFSVRMKFLCICTVTCTVMLCSQLM